MLSRKTTASGGKTKPRKQTFKEEYSKKWTCIASSSKGEVYAR